MQIFQTGTLVVTFSRKGRLAIVVNNKNTAVISFPL